MRALSIYAGNTAYQRIKREGLKASMFTALLGASGGPKWFVLYGLDKVLFSQFLDESNQAIDIIGSSIGAFRAACFMHTDTRAAVERLGDRYSNTIYSAKPTPDEITEKGIDLLQHLLSVQQTTALLAQNDKKLHISVAKCVGLTEKEATLPQTAGLTLAALRNARGRRHLQKSFTRVMFSNTDRLLDFSEQIPFRTEHVRLSEDNLHSALMATGSIPMVIKGVEDIPGAGKGMYRDGGIVDYHFDMNIQTKGLVLYPHFTKTPIPGWFDKGLKSRACHPSSYDNVLMLAPSKEFVASLPYAKIPDRKDFETMQAQQRIDYWHEVMKRSEDIANDFLAWLDCANPEQWIQPISLKR